MSENADFYKEYWDNYDCSEIAEDLYNASGNKGTIIELKTDGQIKIQEYGTTQMYEYHQVYSDGNYIYDPRFSSEPILQSEYFDVVRNLNSGVDVSITDILN